MKTRSFMVIAFIITFLAGTGVFFYRPGNDVAAEQDLAPASAVREAPAGDFSEIDSAPPVLDAMEKVAENEFLALYLLRKTTEVAVFEKRTGELWYSNPPDRG